MVSWCVPPPFDRVDPADIRVSKTFGFATDEFEVTPDRLGVYLPTEHIDNPKYI